MNFIVLNRFSTLSWDLLVLGTNERRKHLKWSKLTSHPKYLLWLALLASKSERGGWFVLLLNIKVHIHPMEEREGWVTLLLARAISSLNVVCFSGMLSIS